MPTTTGHAPGGSRRAGDPPRHHTRPTGLQVVGELLLTAGAVLLLFVAWQLWWTNLEAQGSHARAAAAIQGDLGGPVVPQDGVQKTGPPAVGSPPGYGEAIGVVHIPRFGDDYLRPVVEGTGTDVLDALGLGHYEHSAMPGDVGNFALAGHRQTNGKVLDLVHTLVPGDRIYVRTGEGYYTYTVRSHEIVAPTETRVVAAVPADPGARPTERLLTLTTCHPRYGNTERYVVHAVLDTWRPAAAGPPAEAADAFFPGGPRS
ncbi:class E sortase [Kocuria sp. M1R5S2]|uniref:class E sortase n=1 Tax=Kocuria rhizosphaerae TaxID=3376285 RepID=UPI00378B05E5